MLDLGQKLFTEVTHLNTMLISIVLQLIQTYNLHYSKEMMNASVFIRSNGFLNTYLYDRHFNIVE